MGFLKTPYGTKDFLPKEAKVKRVIENRLNKLFESYGYEEVVTPTMDVGRHFRTKSFQNN